MQRSPDDAFDLGALRHVAVGSANPVKLGAVRAVLARLAPDAAVEGVVVPSGVPDQPWGDAETIQGARELLKNKSVQTKDKVEMIQSLEKVRAFLVEMKKQL